MYQPLDFSIFDEVKPQLTTRQVAEHYGVKVNRFGMACCPFHPDRHPSMKVDKRFYCFACHATGDVFDFAAKFLGTSTYEAAWLLAREFNICPMPTDQRATVRPKQLLSPEEAQRKEELRVLDVLIGYEVLLKKWQEDYAPTSEDDEAPWDKRFAVACLQLVLVQPIIEGLYSPDAEVRKQTLEDIKADGALDAIEQFLREQNEQQEVK